MKIDQAAILEALKRWRLSRSEKAREAIIREASAFIWHFPGFAFRMDDEDVRSDFYLQIISNFDRILDGYDESKHAFSTWLGACLRNAYINLVSRRRIIPSISLDGLTEEGCELADSAGAPFQAEPPSLPETTARHGLERLVVRLYHLDLFDEADFELLLRCSGKPLSECAVFIEELYESVRRKKERQVFFEDRLTHLFQRILRVQKALVELVTSEQDGSPAHGERLREEKELRQRQSQYLAEYRAILVHPSANRIADFLGIPETKVRYYLQTYKRHIQSEGIHGPGSGFPAKAAPQQAPSVRMTPLRRLPGLGAEGARPLAAPKGLNKRAGIFKFGQAQTLSDQGVMKTPRMSPAPGRREQGDATGVPPC